MEALPGPGLGRFIRVTESNSCHQHAVPRIFLVQPFGNLRIGKEDIADPQTADAQFLRRQQHIFNSRRYGLQIADFPNPYISGQI